MKDIKETGSVLLVIVVLLVTSYSHSQEKLEPGDSLTGVFFDTMVNHHTSALDVDKELKDKLVIYDNWGKTCYPCVQGLPKLDSLQQMFGDKIKILPWTEDSKEVVEKIYGRINAKYNMIIPSAAEADRHENLGTTSSNYTAKIWTYNGKVVAVTPTKEVNAKNIQFFLKHGYLNLKEDFPNTNDFTQSRLTDNILYQKETPTFSIKITKGIPNTVPDYETSIKYKIGTPVMGTRHINVPLSMLYRSAFEGYKLETDLNPSDQKRFDPPLEEQNVDNTYCVEIIGKIESWGQYVERKKEANRLLQTALEETFGITMNTEKRMVKTYILTEIPGNDKFKADTKGEEVWDKTAFYLRIENLPAKRAFKAITSKLPYRSKILYAANELTYTGNISLDITARTYEYEAMKPALAEYGLDLSIGEREKEVWVVKKL